jgi:hypothetical protein
MQVGTQMTLHFDLLDEWPDQPASFDSEAVIDLQALGGREAIAAMRRCVESRRCGKLLSAEKHSS